MVAGSIGTRRLGRAELSGDPVLVAPRLLNKVVRHGSRSGRIIEVEAYRGSDDPASHAHRGRTDRNAAMFGPPGVLYVYFVYGMHWCANVVAHEPGEPGAVLIRALEPMTGMDEMAALRPLARRRADLVNGPAKLCQALGIDGTFDGMDLTDGASPIELLDDGVAPPVAPLVDHRVGISVGRDLAWRFRVR